MNKFVPLSLLLAATLLFSSCADDEETPETPAPVAQNDYVFVDGNGNNTVDFSEQAQRLEMLSEMVTYMRTANTSGTALDAQIMKNMYANQSIIWMDTDEIGMNESEVQLRDKTGSASSGMANPGTIQYFEGLMDALAGVSMATVSGVDTGGPGVPGVVVSTTEPSIKYLQDANGAEYLQYIEKGLMGAVFYNQMVVKYLGDEQMALDNTTAVAPDSGLYHTEMEHAWDAAYGYFTSVTDYTPGGAGTDRFWGKYADGREAVLGSASTIDLAFRTGRKAIVDNDLELRDEQIAIIREEMDKVVAGTAIHYINSTIANFADDALRNHALSEAIAFISDLPYGYESPVTQPQTTQWFITIGSDFYDVTTEDLLSVRTEIAALYGLSGVQSEL